MKKVYNFDPWIYTVFHAASESTVLTEIMQLNWLENRSELAILFFQQDEGKFVKLLISMI